MYSVWSNLMRMCVCFHGIFRNELYVVEIPFRDADWQASTYVQMKFGRLHTVLVALQTAKATGVELRAQGGSHESSASLWYYYRILRGLKSGDKTLATSQC